VYLVGAGGHAEVLRETLLESGVIIAGYITRDGNSSSATGSLPVIAEDSVRESLDPNKVLLVNAIGSTSDLTARNRASQHLTSLGYTFGTVISKHALVAESAVIAAGAQVLRGAIVNTAAHVGAHAIINSGAIVEHHVTVGESAHIAPGAVVCGASVVGSAAHIGAGATVVQGITIGAGGIVGAGAVVLANVSAGDTVVGVPARVIATKGQS
jgi:UDP-perosamine 4-acetyltransferase